MSAYDNLQQINSKITRKMFNQFYYYRCKPVIEQVVFNTLDRLKNDGAIEYEQTYKITENSDFEYIADGVDADIIKHTEKDILTSLGYENFKSLLGNEKIKDFYSKVVEAINEIYNRKWKYYTKVVKVRVDTARINDIKRQLAVSDDQLIAMKKEISYHLITSVKKKTMRDYEKTNCEAETVKTEWKSNLEDSKLKESIADNEIRELYELGLVDKEKIIDWYIQSPTPFEYYDNYIDIQGDIIKYFLGEIELDHEENPEWLERI